MQNQTRNISILGFGIMGASLAQLFAQKGFTVFVTDTSSEALSNGLERIRNGQFGLQKLVEKGKLSLPETEEMMQRIHVTQDLSEAVRNTNLVLENVNEDLVLKKAIFKELDTLCPPHVILATNTTSLSITGIASSTNIPERVIGMHFFNPPQVMKLVEVIPGIQTSSDTIETVQRVAKDLGKATIMVRDTPGFVASRAGLALFAEASRMLDEGVATVKDIDVAMRLAFGHPMGQFELTDLIGLDVRLAAFGTMYGMTGEARWKAPLLLQQLVESGYLGDRKLKRDSKGGYYDYFKIERE